MALIHVDGEVDTNSSGQLETALNTLLEQGARTILLELSGMDYVSSVGLRVLLATLKKLRADQGRMVLNGWQQLLFQLQVQPPMHPLLLYLLLPHLLQ